MHHAPRSSRSSPRRTRFESWPLAARVSVDGTGASALGFSSRPAHHRHRKWSINYSQPALNPQVATLEESGHHGRRTSGLAFHQGPLSRHGSNAKSDNAGRTNEAIPS